MATITDNSDIEIQLKKIPCLNDKGCEFQKEIMENLEVILKIVQANQIEFTDHRKALVIILEEHGIPCDDVFGWDLNNYREKKKDVRESRIQRNRHKNTTDNDRKGSFIKRKKQERKIRRGKKNV